MNAIISLNAPSTLDVISNDIVLIVAVDSETVLDLNDIVTTANSFRMVP
jgi:hypothetical protein